MRLVRILMVSVSCTPLILREADDQGKQKNQRSKACDAITAPSADLAPRPSLRPPRRPPVLSPARWSVEGPLRCSRSVRQPHDRGDQPEQHEKNAPYTCRVTRRVPAFEFVVFPIILAEYGERMPLPKR